jgi:hypothetical protein
MSYDKLTDALLKANDKDDVLNAVDEQIARYCDLVEWACNSECQDPFLGNGPFDLGRKHQMKLYANRFGEAAKYRRDLITQRDLAKGVR